VGDVYWCALHTLKKSSPSEQRAARAFYWRVQRMKQNSGMSNVTEVSAAAAGHLFGLLRLFRRPLRGPSCDLFQIYVRAAVFDRRLLN
jgi:hypothetical protein